MRFVFRLHEYYRSLERQNCRASLGYWTIGSNEYPTLITRISQEIIKIRKCYLLRRKIYNMESNWWSEGPMYGLSTVFSVASKSLEAAKSHISRIN
jgi:hypothetical protein